MKYISVSYAIKYMIDFAPEYKFVNTNICINAKTGRIIKQTICGRSIGYCIKGKFYSLSYLRSHLIKPEKLYRPF